MAERSFTQRARSLGRRGIEQTVIRTFALRERIESGVAWNPTTRSYRLNPYPTYTAVRETDPVHRSRFFAGWIITRYEDVSELLRNSKLSSDDRNRLDYAKNRRRLIDEGLLEEGEQVRPSLLRLDPPDHTRLRTLVSKAFTPRAVEALRPRIEQLVDELVGQMGPEADVVSELAIPLPVMVISEMLGVPVADRARFKEWSDAIATTVGLQTAEQFRSARQAERELNAYLAPIAEARRREPREDLLSALVAAEEAGDRLSMDEVFDTVQLLLVAGNETTTNLIGNGLLSLLRNPAEFQKLRDDPGLAPAATEELLRFDSPVQLTSRIVMEDFEFRGKPFATGQEVTLLLGSANRDSRQFGDPDRLNLNRQEVRHLSFSQGIHYCLGAPLARLEGAIAFRALATEFKSIELNGKAKRGHNIVLRGLTSLPVRLER